MIDKMAGYPRSHSIKSGLPNTYQKHNYLNYYDISSNSRGETKKVKKKRREDIKCIERYKSRYDVTVETRYS